METVETGLQVYYVIMLHLTFLSESVTELSNITYVSNNIKQNKLRF